MAEAKGNASLEYGGQTMKADLIRYDPATRQVDLTGKVEIRTGTSVQRAEHVTLWLTPDGRKKIEGPHTVNMLKFGSDGASNQLTVQNGTLTLAPLAGGSPGNGATNAAASPVAATLAPKGTFKGNDGIEIRDTKGSSPTFRVGGTYHVRGVCRQNSLEHATLLLGNTAVGNEEAIKPAAGTALSMNVPKGSTEFDFAFTPTRPGTLHITIYDMDNHDPLDTAYAGIYLGEVAP